MLSGFFTSYNGQDNRHGTMQVDFLNAGGTSLGSTVITSQLNPNPWHQERGAAFIPVGTATLRTSLFGDNFNAYIDNVDVRVTEAANELLYLEVNTTTGQTAIKNQTGDASPHRLLQSQERRRQPRSMPRPGTAFRSRICRAFRLATAPAMGGSNSAAAARAWSANRYLTGNSPSRTRLRRAGRCVQRRRSPRLEFQYVVVTESPAAAGDFDGDGDVDGADYPVWQRGYTAGTPNQNPAATPTVMDDDALSGKRFRRPPAFADPARQ